MKGIAGSGLLHLAEQGFLISQDQVSDALTSVDGRVKVRRRDVCDGGRDLDRRAGERIPRSQPSEGADCSLPTDDGAFVKAGTGFWFCAQPARFILRCATAKS